MDYGLAGRVMLVTGAGSGIGRAAAVLAAGMGARVVAADVDQDRSAATAALIAWLCSDGASFVTGEGLTLDGGLLAR